MTDEMIMVDEIVCLFIFGFLHSYVLRDPPSCVCEEEEPHGVEKHAVLAGLLFLVVLGYWKLDWEY